MEVQYEEMDLNTKVWMGLRQKERV